MRILLLLAVFALSTTAVAQNRTLSCSTDLQTRVACYVEQPIVVFGAFEVAIGLDTLAAKASHVAPYVLAGYYAERWSVSIEWAFPQVLPIIGRPNQFRVTFTTRF